MDLSFLDMDFCTLLNFINRKYKEDSKKTFESITFLLISLMTQLQCYGIIWYIRGRDISITIDEAKNYTNLETPEGYSPVYVTKFVADVFVKYFYKDYTNQETTLKPKTKGLID